MTAFDWDSTIENDGGDFRLLEPGVHPFTVKALEKGYYNGGKSVPPCPQAKLTLRVGQGTEVSDATATLLLDDSLEWKLCQFFLSIGARKHGEQLKMDWDSVVGKSGWCETAHREYRGGDGEMRTTNDIVRFIDPADVAQMQAAPSAQAPQHAQQPAQTAAAGW